MERKAEKALLASAVYLTVKWASSPFGLPGVSGKLASLYSLEYILELTEKSQCCGSDNSVWQKGLQLPGKCTERTLLAITFLWESRIPYKESSKVTMPTSSGVQDKWCLFHLLPSIPKPPRLSLSMQHGAKQCASEMSESPWGTEVEAAPPPFAPRPLYTTVLFRRSFQSTCSRVLTLRKL